MTADLEVVLEELDDIDNPDFSVGDIKAIARDLGVHAIRLRRERKVYAEALRDAEQRLRDITVMTERLKAIVDEARGIAKSTDSD